MRDIEKLLSGNRLTTVEILYHLPDHPSLLQSYVWQTFDRAPDYPRLQRFLEYWDAHIEGKLHSVKLASAELVRPADFRFASGTYYLH
ncbi:MAG: Usg family protein [Alphaproteobacteria bacterium]|jgi:uncharacterized protein Usg|nr:Usg family protein [Alphaproteobacteria bacterium]MDP6516569.1 Usg family protein [Alphaproteobacteria bacterium]|tara:strand:+ start:134 stop:397 length:264 start_codon:yes stop_codon:yes gene_type:complete